MEGSRSCSDETSKCTGTVLSDSDEDGQEHEGEIGDFVAATGMQ